MRQAAAGRRRNARLVAAVAGLLLAAGCAEGPQLPFLQAKDKPVTQSSSTRLVERDVEAPEVFQVTEAGLWDGRPSVGGVWVAHPDTKEPERVIIRNNANGQFVIGALFRREREIPGPRLQVSSDAAAALGMLAGAPVELNVTALRREAVEDEAPAEDLNAAGLDLDAQADAAEGGSAALAADAAAAITATALDPAPAAASVEAAAAAEAPARAPARPKPQASGLDKPYIQIGIFSVEANAERAAGMMRSAGMVPSVQEQNSSGKTFWRVLVGPAQNKSERSQLLNSVKETGFSDAYAVSS
ncbi:SPOR domain-containing protein [Cribrihabitans neustonicus]